MVHGAEYAHSACPAQLCIAIHCKHDCAQLCTVSKSSRKILSIVFKCYYLLLARLYDGHVVNSSVYRVLT